MASRWDAESATLTEGQALHLARVLRAQPGMRFDVVAGERVWLAEVATVSEQAVQFTLLEELERERALPLTLFPAIFKFDRLEWAIEKATELGVARIIPLLARRTEKHLAQAASARVERWRRIAQEAAKQSRRAETPVIENPLAVREAARLMPEAQLLLLSEQQKLRSLRTALEDANELDRNSATEEGDVSAEREIALAVGPEGGWAEDELAIFDAQGWTPVSLGPRVLRAETAAIAGAAIVAALLD